MLGPARTIGPAGLYLRCAGWGVATGAAIGGLAGAIGGVSLVIAGQAGLAAVALLYGTVVGTLVAVVPSALGAAVVAAVISRRHPRPAAAEAVRSDLAFLFCALVGVLDGAVLLAVLAAGADGSYLAGFSLFLLAVNACVALVLHFAGRDLSRTWAGDPDGER
jgi:hypothetical protein